VLLHYLSRRGTRQYGTGGFAPLADAGRNAQPTERGTGGDNTVSVAAQGVGDGTDAFVVPGAVLRERPLPAADPLVAGVAIDAQLLREVDDGHSDRVVVVTLEGVDVAVASERRRRITWPSRFQPVHLVEPHEQAVMMALGRFGTRWPLPSSGGRRDARRRPA
jgi:hypothetical protein